MSCLLEAGFEALQEKCMLLLMSVEVNTAFVEVSILMSALIVD